MIKWPLYPHGAHYQGWTHRRSTDTQKPPWLCFTPSLLHTRADNHSLYGRCGCPWNVPKDVTGESEHLLRSQLQSIDSTTIGSSQLLHKAEGFLLNSVLNAPLPHPQVPQHHEGEAPNLLPSLSIAKDDSYQEGNQTREGLGHEEWADTWKPRRRTELCWEPLHIPLHHPPQSYYQCQTCAHAHSPRPFLDFSHTGLLAHPENASPRWIRASFTASYPQNTTTGFMPKYRVYAGP